MAVMAGKYFSQDSKLKECTHFEPEIFETGVVVYEVVRVINGIVLFLEDHFSRLQESLSLSSYSYSLTLQELSSILTGLIHNNHFPTGNIKIILHFTHHQPPHLYAFFIPHYYPDASMYENGVESDFFRAARVDPNVKKLNAVLIEKVDAFIKTNHLYDALLVSDDETVTEGSRTNIFFIRGEQVFTAPATKVLKGITRQKVMQLCKELHIPVLEIVIPMKNLETFDAAFFSGTSPKILPISRISGIHFDTNHAILRKIMHAYEDVISAYCQKNRTF